MMQDVGEGNLFICQVLRPYATMLEGRTYSIDEVHGVDEALGH